MLKREKIIRGKGVINDKFEKNLQTLFLEF